MRNVFAPLLQNSYSDPSITLNEAGGPRTIISNVSSVKSFPLFNVIFAWNENVKITAKWWSGIWYNLEIIEAYHESAFFERIERL